MKKLQKKKNQNLDCFKLNQDIPVENLLQKIKKNWELNIFSSKSSKRTNKKILKKPLKILVCVSGGSDSVALLHILYSLRKILFIELFILHFNHNIRTESDQDQFFVKTLAEKFQIPFYLKKTNNFFNGQSGFQESARKWRISESKKLLKVLKGDYIATGHHAEDQIETLLLKILRGVHISKLYGMSWIKKPFLRPLLNCEKSELQDYLLRKKLTWMEDTSNKKSTYLRNRVRLDLIPLLKELTRDGLKSRIFDLIDQSKILRNWLDYNYFSWVKVNSEKKFYDSSKINIAEFVKVERILQEEIIHNFINEKTGKSLNYLKLKKIFDLIYSENKKWELHLSKDWKIYLCEDVIRLKKIF